MIEVISAGIFSSIQDQGRFGSRNIGVPVSGAMDLYSANLANALLNNSLESAVLETTVIGPVLHFLNDTFISITGAVCPIELNGIPIPNNCVHKVNATSTLSIGRVQNGMRTYLGIAGGFQTKKVLKSRSYYHGITKNKQIRQGDLLKTSLKFKKIINRAKVKTKLSHLNQHAISVTYGPEFNRLEKQTQDKLLTSQFILSNQSNRMAYRLDKYQRISAAEIITSSVQPGTVQLTPSGELIILMRDCQTTGGYARVLQLTENSINQLAQKSAGSDIKFVVNNS